MSSNLPVLRVSEIGEYVRHQSCERRFRLEANRRELARQLPFAERLFSSLDPVLQEIGRKRESEWEVSLLSSEIQDLTEYRQRPLADKTTEWAIFAEMVGRLSRGRNGYGREISVEAELGAFKVEGRIDFVLVLWRNGRPRLRLVECKASRRDRTYHRIQLVIYREIVRRLLERRALFVDGEAIDPMEIECVVARIDEDSNEIQSILDLDPLSLDMEEADVDRLLADDGALLEILGCDLDELDFELNEKCDGCVFNLHCLSESGRQRRLELLSVPPAAVRSLRAAGLATIDDLANFDLESTAAQQLRQDPGFSENLSHLSQRARARRRTLPGGGLDPDAFEVEALSHTGKGQLPAHIIGGRRLIRIYLAVDYDYSENRLGALSAHVTSSEGQIHTGFQEIEGRPQPNPQVQERLEVGRDSATNRPIFQNRALQGSNIEEFIPSEWTGRYEVDSGAEKQLIQGFFQKLVDSIAEIAGEPEAPIHFYVWSRSEMARLVEACSRVSSRLLSHLRELLGCRESLEQLLYSCLQAEVDSRYALGWTGRGLTVVSSLRWFGRRYHWRRRVGGTVVDLDRLFAQDLFDFKTDLDLREDGSWASPKETARRHKFEIRSRFHDSLPAPYWRAYWRTLPAPDSPGITSNVANAIRRYEQAARPGVLREYLRARTHALRWIEEGVRFKNDEITKPLMTIADLPSFSLSVDDAARASIDFLRLDQHVKVTDWISAHLIPPIDRINQGRTIPVGPVISHGDHRLIARINLEEYGIDSEALRARCSIAEGSFVRLSPCAEDPRSGQTFGQLMRGGKTCRVEAIDWEAGEIELSAIWIRDADRYRLFSSGAGDPGDVFGRATIDESVSDFVAGRVEARLQAGLGNYVFQWFDPEAPQIPPSAQLKSSLRESLGSMLSSFSLPNGRFLAPDQIAAVREGLETRVQLLQGPPGTGKTTTTAVAVLARILLKRNAGDVVILAANTHTAIDNLLRSLDGMVDIFRDHFSAHGLIMPAVQLAKVHSSGIEDPLGGGILDFPSKPCVNFVRQARRNQVLVIGGTTSALLKMANELCGSSAYKNLPNQFQVSMLVVDEASMMVFPHFLALATLVSHDGEVMLAGDHRQLAPIVAHDWEREDRPPAVVYQPFSSAYQAIANIASKVDVGVHAARRSALSFTFRLPPMIRDLIGRLYRLDDIELDGLPRQATNSLASGLGSLEQVWHGETGLFLVLHNERRSRQSNPIEAKIVRDILAAGGVLPRDSVAVMTPHRAQRSLLRDVLAGYYPEPVGIIDTVERLQGGEKPTVIVSATASDPSAISARVDFILDLNRSNVAFSRAMDRLIVVCSHTLLDYIPSESEHYESAMLWKSLRAICSHQLGSGSLEGYDFKIFTVPVMTDAIEG